MPERGELVLDRDHRGRVVEAADPRELPGARHDGEHRGDVEHDGRDGEPRRVMVVGEERAQEQRRQHAGEELEREQGGQPA